MAELLEFRGTLKEFVSSAMSKMATNSQRSIASVNRGLASISRNTNRPASSISALNSRIDELRKKRDISIDTSQVRRANREISLLERKMEKMENMGRRNRGGGGVGLGGMLAGAGATYGIGQTINAGFQAQAQQTSFEVLSGKKEGKQLFDELTKYAQDSIYGEEVKKNAQTLLAFGEANNKVMGDIKMLGDIAMGNKQRFESLTLAYAQSQSTGRLMGQDLLQMVNAGFNPLQIISEKTGVSMGVLKKRMEDGLISFAMVEQAFKDATSEGGKFFGMTEKIGQTDFGKWEAFQGQISGLAMQFGLALAPAIGDIISNGLVPLATWVGQNQDLVLGLGSVLLTSVGAYKAVTIAQGLLNVAMSANPVGLIVAGIAALAAGFYYAYTRVGEFRGGMMAAWESVKGFAMLIKDVVVDRIKGLLVGITGIGSALMSFFKGDWAIAIETGKKAIVDLSGAGTMKKISDGMKQIGKDAAKAYAKGYSEVEEKGKKDTSATGLMAGFTNASNPLAGGGSAGGGNAYSAASTSGSSVGTPSGIGSSKSITINIQKVVENINITPQTMQQGVAELGTLIRDELERVLASVSYAR